jgi:uncharacterized protein YjdB
MDKEMHFIPTTPWRLPALLGVFLFSLFLWSCNTGSEDDVYTVTFKLDPARIGKFDSVRVDIYNGAAPGPGDSSEPVQSKVIALTPTTKEISLQLNAKVKKDFSVVITGFTGKEITYRNLHEVDGFTSPDPGKPSILLISRIVAEDLTVNVGETRSPVLTLTPENAVDKRILLFSSDSLTVRVVGDSVQSLKGLKTGDIKVTATTADKSIKVEFTVKVVGVRVAKLQSDPLSLKVGDRVVPTVTILPDNATDRNFILESSNPEVLAVSGKGLEALKPGNVKLILISADGGAKDTVAVSVRIAVTGLKGKDLVKEAGDRFAPVLEWTPGDATDQGYSLSSSDPAKVSVDGDSLEAEAVGTATITATSRDGKIAAAFEVKVDTKVFRVKGVKAAALRILVGDTTAPDLTWDPANASDKGFVLVSRNSGVVQVIGDKLEGLKADTATIVITTVDGGFKDSIVVAVELAAFQTDVLPITTFKCAPCHDPGQTFNWQDSAQLVHKGASAIDRLTRPESSVGKMPLNGAPNGNLSARQLRVLLSWLNRVAIPVKSVSLADMAANFGDSVLPALTWDPPNASNQTVVLTTSDTVLAPVIAGHIVPQGTGNFTVFATTDEGNRKLQAKLTVGPPLFTKNILPITTFKCAPCHEPGQTFNFQDSTLLILSGAKALDRLQRDPSAAGKMPLRGAPNGDLSAFQKAVILAWLNTKVIPLKGITVGDDSVLIDESKAPKITYDPVNANNKAYFLASSDATKLGIDGDHYFGIAVGTVQVEVRALDGNHLKLISVKVKPVPLDSLAAFDTAGAIGDTLIPRVEYFPANTTSPSNTLSLPNASTVVSIAAGSKSVVGIGLGKDTVTVSAPGGLIQSKFIVTVGPVAPKGLTAKDTNNVIGVQVKPTLVWNPATTTDKRFTLAIAAADTLIAAVRTDSFVLGKAVGKVNVTVTSVTDPTLKDVFAFTVGPVPVVGLTATSTVQFASGTASLNARSFITWNPANATDKRFQLVSLAPAKVLVLTDTTVRTQGLGITSVTVKSLSDTTKKATWSVNVIRPLFTGGIKNTFTTKCQECHGPVAWPARNWQDSTQVVSFRALIKTRINALDANIMPPAGATAGPLTAAEIASLTTWLSYE